MYNFSFVGMSNSWAGPWLTVQRFICDILFAKQCGVEEFVAFWVFTPTEFWKEEKIIEAQNFSSVGRKRDVGSLEARKFGVWL